MIRIMFIAIIILFILLGIYVLYLWSQTEDFNEFWVREFQFFYDPQLLPDIITMEFLVTPEDRFHIGDHVLHVERRGPAVRRRRRRAGTRQERVEDHINEQQFGNHNNDPQNAHDKEILSQLTKKIQRLQELYNKRHGEIKHYSLRMSEIETDLRMNETIQEIYQYATGAGLEENKVKIVELILKEIGKNNTIVSVAYERDAQGERIPLGENWILTLVWDRINHADNSAKCEEMRSMLIDQLLDCIEKNDEVMDFILNLIMNPARNISHHLVCIGGRVSRVVSTLTLLDADPALCHPELDKKELANLIYTRTAQRLKEALVEQHMEELYNKSEDSLSESEREKVDKFIRELHEKIRRHLNDEFHQYLSGVDLKRTIDDALAGIS